MHTSIANSVHKLNYIPYFMLSWKLHSIPVASAPSSVCLRYGTEMFLSVTATFESLLPSGKMSYASRLYNEQDGWQPVTRWDVFRAEALVRATTNSHLVFWSWTHVRARKHPRTVLLTANRHTISVPVVSLETVTPCRLKKPTRNEEEFKRCIHVLHITM